MQGPVYGIGSFLTPDQDFNTGHFFYDEIFGTVLNRFVCQAVIGKPLSVYGKGMQTRGYINIVDSIQCLLLAHEKPGTPGNMRFYNQITETFSVLDLAKKVQDACEKNGIQVTTQSVANPRIEAEEHYYNPKYSGLTDLGLKPALDGQMIMQMFEAVAENKDAIKTENFSIGVQWKR